MKILIILLFILMYFILWCFLRVASLADKEYDYIISQKDDVNRKRLTKPF